MSSICEGVTVISRWNLITERDLRPVSEKYGFEGSSKRSVSNKSSEFVVIYARIIWLCLPKEGEITKEGRGFPLSKLLANGKTFSVFPKCERLILAFGLLRVS